MKKRTWLSNRSTKIFILVFSMVFIFGFGILFFFSYVYFENIFEDRVIDEYTYKKTKNLALKMNGLLESLQIILMLSKQFMEMR